MFTDEMLEAIEIMVENCENEEQAAGMEQVKNMLADFDEDAWNDMDSDEKNDWISQFINK